VFLSYASYLNYLNLCISATRLSRGCQSSSEYLLAPALRQLLLKHDFSGFSHIPEKRHAIGYSDLAAIFLTAENDREKALEKLKEFDQLRSKSKDKNDQIFQLAIPAIRNWLSQYQPQNK
jgi:hypothetical protein